MTLVEKYRPKTLSELYGNNKTKAAISKMVLAVTENDERLPHILLHGPEGTGKTSLAEIIRNMVDADMLELNASNERGIDVIRNKVKDFTKMKSVTGAPRIVFLDEADALTKDAQNALRRIMEKSVASFILSANNYNKIIKPLKSRCTKFKFEYPDKVTLEQFILDTLKKEGIYIDVDIVKKIASVSKEYRSALNELEKLKGMISVTAEDVSPDSGAREIWKGLQDHNLYDKALYAALKSDPAALVEELTDIVVESNFSPEKKGVAITVLAEADARIATGASGKVQVSFVMFQLRQILT